VFEGADEGFGPGVIVRVGACRHALTQAGLGQSLTEEPTAVLAAAIAVEDGAASGACLQGLLKMARTNSERIWGARLQPTMRREHRSMTTAK
jgi:hypothetical protein